MRRHRWSTAGVGTPLMIAAAVGVFAGPVWAQTQDAFPPLKWTARERYLTHTGANADDRSVDIMYWFEDVPGGTDRHWVYATGWVTQLNSNGGSAKGKRFAIYKYDGAVDTQGTPQYSLRAYFPDSADTISQGDIYKAVALTVDPANGDIYVVGEGPHAAGTANNQDYFIVKYNKNLVQQWSGATSLAKARTYEGGNGNDIPADITLSVDPSGVVMVTGTSPGATTGKDIATVAWFTADGSRAVSGSDYWPSNGAGDGVRRYDGGHGDDRAVEIVPLIITEEVQFTRLTAAVLGTSWNGSDDDFVMLLPDTTGILDAANFDLGGNDVATGLAFTGGSCLWCGGYSEIIPPGDAPQNDIDFSIVAFDVGVGGVLSDAWHDTKDYSSGHPDYSFDVAAGIDGNGDAHVWMVGYGGTGARQDVFSVHYLDDFLTSPLLNADWRGGFNAGGSSTYNYGYAVALQPSEALFPYITGTIGGANFDYLLALKYKDTPTPYTRHWNRLYNNSALIDEGRAITVRDIGGHYCVFIAGTSAASGNGQDFIVQKYKE